jgi:hypothetical protein
VDPISDPYTPETRETRTGSPIRWVRSVFAVEREGQHDPAQPSREIGFVLSLHGLEMASQRLDDGGWQYGWPVLLTFAASNHNLPPLHIDVLHAKLQAFVQPQSAAVQEGHHNPRDTMEMLHDARDLVAAQDNRHANRHASARHVLDRADLDVEDIAIQEQKRAERLVLR